MGVSHSTQRVLVVVFLAVRYYYGKKEGQHAETVLRKLAAIFEHYPALGDLLGLWLINELMYTVRYGLRLSMREIYDISGAWGYNLLCLLAPAQVHKEQDKIAGDLRHKLKPKDRTIVTALPKEGRKHQDILLEMQKYHEIDVQKWKGGKVSGAVYHGGEDHIDFLNKAGNLYHVSNPLHADLFPSVMKFEAEICAMTAGMMNNGGKEKEVCGAMLSGGTESIIMAAKAHRAWAERTKGITRPEIVACVTAHAAIDKACDMLGIRLVKVPCDPKTFKINVGAVKRALTNDTIMVYSSAPNFPSGIIDPVSELSEIAHRHGCGLHVDCCLGGFYLPFLRTFVNVPDFDFRCRGVTTMSCDTHKYGYAIKGTSVLLFRSKELRHHMYFTYPGWTGGLYVTPSTAGSRPGSLIASCWAAMVRLGEVGYIDATKKINEVVVKFKKALAAGEIPGCHLMGDPIAMVVGWGSNQFNIYTLSDKMAHKGYSLSNCQKPAMIHICFTLQHAEPGSLERILSDLKVCALECIDETQKGAKLTGNAPMYGMAEMLPEGPVIDVLRQYTDIVLES